MTTRAYEIIQIVSRKYQRLIFRRYLDDIRKRSDFQGRELEDVMR
jgi:hypothetical protein